MARLGLGAAAAEPDPVDAPLAIREIDLVHFSHTDVGFTDSPSVCRELYRRYLDIALDAIRDSMNQPEDERFRWTTESTLAVNDWWQAAPPERRALLLEAVRAGQLDITALACNNTPFLNAAQFDNCDRSSKRYGKEVGVRSEIERGLKLTAACADFRELRQKFDALYSGTGIPYAQSYANEVVTKAVSVLRLVRGNTWEAMKAAVNLGRDTDCLAAVAGDIAGALCGAGSVPAAVIQQVDTATSVNPHNNSKRTLRETADGLYSAYRARLRRLRTFVEAMEPA